MQGGIFVSKREQIIYSIIESYRNGRLSRAEAALKMGVSERTITRKAQKVREKGIAGVKHGNCEKLPWNKKDEATVRKYIDLYRTRYKRFNFAHALDMMAQMEEMRELSYSTFQRACRKEGLGKIKKRRSSKARLARERSAEEGFMWQLDGSPEKWNLVEDWTLIGLIDDATSKIPGARFEKSETTWGCMKVTKDAIGKNGIPEFILTDMAGWSSDSVKRRHFSQFERACRELGITVITTPTPESKGRIERMNRTFQDRIIPELDLFGITGITDANRYLEQCFIPGLNEQFSVEPKSITTRYRSVPPDVDLKEIFCLKYKRKVARDHTVSYAGKTYRIDPGEHGNLAKKGITVHQYEDGSLNIFYGREKLDYQRMERPRRWKRKKWAS